MGLLSLVFLDKNSLSGKIVDPSLPALLVTDAGVEFGDGVFETILAVGGVLQEKNPHFLRLVRSAHMLDLPTPNLVAWDAAVSTALGEAKKIRGSLTGELVVKLFYTRGTVGVANFTSWVSVAEVSNNILKQRSRGVEAITLTRGTSIETEAVWLLQGAKTLSYAINIAALRYAGKQNADEAIFVSNDNHILEGATSNVVIAKGTTLFSPPASSGILAGTTQLALFKKAQTEGWNVKYENFTIEDVYKADATFLTSSIRLTVPVTYLNKVKLKTLFLF